MAINSSLTPRYNGRCATSRILDFVGNLHDLEAYQSINNNLALTQYIYSTHWGHLAVIYLWLSGTLFHIGWTGNFSTWLKNPVSTIAISHPIWDPHFSSSTSYFNSVPAYSGVYHWLYAVGYRQEFQIYNSVIALELLALSFILLGKLHLSNIQTYTTWLIDKRPVVSESKPSGYVPGLYSSSTQLLSKFVSLPIRFYSTYIDALGTRLNFHLSSLFGTFSALWSGHLVHVSIPASRGYGQSILFESHSSEIDLGSSLLAGSWSTFMKHPDSVNHVFGYSYGAGSSVLTFIGGISPSSGALLLSDIAHHHLALGVLFIWASHLYSAFFKGLGHKMQALLSSAGLSLVTKYLIKSLHLQLSLSLLCISITTSLVAHQMYSLPAYPYISYDYVTTVALYVHHNWIATLLMVGAFSHSSLFLIRDYTRAGSDNQDIVARLLFHKASIVSHLSWVSLFLGFHTLGLYVHNDVVVAFGEPYKQLLVEPFIAHSLMNGLSFSAKSYGYLGGSALDLTHINPIFSSDLLGTSLGPGDFLAYHAISLGLHVTSLILIKGALDSKGSLLMPDKAQFGFGFACDGPSRGGTCDISSWDAFYLALFWALNSNSWTMFFFHWKHLLYWQSLSLKFEENSTFLNGWFRDYLWFNSAALIRGYDPTGANDLSVLAWAFLAAHLCWAVGFMFLISWRGYWQELIDSILFMHLKTPFVFSLWRGNSYTPIALSIVQARFIGLFHFSVGLILTYAAFVLGSTS